MGTSLQAAKRNRQSKIFRSKNRAFKSTVKNAMKAFETETDSGKKEDSLKSMYSLLDKAGQTNLWHPRKAARNKSHLAKKLNALKAGKTPASA